MGNCNENNQIKHKNKLDSINTNNKSSKIIVGSDFVIEGMGDAFSLCDNKKNIILSDLKDLYPEKTEKKYHNVDKMRSIGVLNEEKELCDKIIEYKKKIGADYDDWEIKKDNIKVKIDIVSAFVQDGVWNLDTYKKKILEQYKWEVKLLLFVEKDPSLNEQQKKVLKDRVNKRKQIIDTELKQNPEEGEKSEEQQKQDLKKEEAPEGPDLYPEKTEKKYHNVDKMTSIGVLNDEKDLCDKIIEYKKKIGADYDDWEIKKDNIKDKKDKVSSFIQDGVWNLDKYKKNIMEQYKWEVKLLQFVEKDPSLNEQQKKVLKDRVNKRKQIIDTEIKQIPEDEEEPKTFTKKLNDTSQNKNSPNISDINRYITKINELEKKLNEEKEKNQIIINENNNLTKKINELKIELNQIEDLKQTINKLNIELNQLKESNLKLENYIRQNNINILNISSQQNNKDVYYDLNSLNLNPNDKIISVNFVSMGNNDIGHYSLVCKYKDLFVKLEERLYNDFQQFTNYETYFEANGRRVKRFKTLEQNNIKNNDIINIFIIEE